MRRATSRHCVCGQLCFRSQPLFAVPTQFFCQHSGPLICKLSPVRLPSDGDNCVYRLAKHWHGMFFDYNMKHKRRKKRVSLSLNHLKVRGSQSKWFCSYISIQLTNCDTNRKKISVLKTCYFPSTIWRLFMTPLLSYELTLSYAYFSHALGLSVGAAN